MFCADGNSRPRKKEDMSKLLKVRIKKEGDQHSTTLESEQDIMLSEVVSVINSLCRSAFRQCATNVEFCDVFDHIILTVNSAHKEEFMLFGPKGRKEQLS